METFEKENKSDDIVKITVSKEAEEKLMLIIHKVNCGFDAGRINRQELASWALIHFSKICDSEMINDIRKEHFNDFMVLESILKQGKRQGKLPKELRNILLKQLTVDEKAEKK